MYFPTSHMKLMRCFNLIIIKITSLFSYLAEFDSPRCMEQECLQHQPTGRGKTLRSFMSPKCPLHSYAARMGLSNKLSLRQKNKGKESGGTLGKWGLGLL